MTRVFHTTLGATIAAATVVLMAAAPVSAFSGGFGGGGYGSGGHMTGIVGGSYSGGVGGWGGGGYGDNQSYPGGSGYRGPSYSQTPVSHPGGGWGGGNYGYNQSYPGGWGNRSPRHYQTPVNHPGGGGNRSPDNSHPSARRGGGRGNTNPGHSGTARSDSSPWTSLGALGALALALPLAWLAIMASRRWWRRNQKQNTARVVLIGDQGRTRMTASGTAPADPVITLRLLASTPVSTLRLAV